MPGLQGHIIETEGSVLIEAEPFVWCDRTLRGGLRPERANQSPADRLFPLWLPQGGIPNRRSPVGL